jgi:glucosamine kinase
MAARHFKIGVDGGGTKTECILVDVEGNIVAVHVGAGCNPSVVGPSQARSIVMAALESLRAQAAAQVVEVSPSGSSDPWSALSVTMLCMAGSRAFWQAFAADLAGFGRVVTTDDSLPVLELATHGQPGLVLHAGTGSFVAARAPDGSVHYAGGLGWRFGDPGSGYDLGRRAIVRALREAQGSAAATPLGTLVREHTQLGPNADASTITHYFYHHAEANRQIATLAPGVLRLAGEGDHVAREIVMESSSELLELATHIAAKHFPVGQLGTVRAGLSGPILTHPALAPALMARSALSLVPVEGTPIEGVRRLLAREVK